MRREVSGDVTRSALFIVLFTTLLAFAVLYMPQPILPLLAAEFMVAETEAALLTSVAMVPLGFAPILYGFLAEHITTKSLLRVAVASLAVTQTLLGVVSDFWVLLLTLLALGMSGLFLPSLAGAYLFIFVMCGGFFLVHSLLSAFVNDRATESKGLVTGSASPFTTPVGAGELVARVPLRAEGWSAFIAALMLLPCVTFWWILRLRPVS